MEIPKTNSLSQKRNWLFMFLLLFSLIAVGCDASKKKITSNQEKQEQREQKKAKENKIVTEFAARHEAILDWNKELLSKSGYRRHYQTV